jgi:2,3-bisphosphoglycerate-dependent phosphoglycerate mutase
VSTHAADNVQTVLLVRHARSTANADPSVYRTTPDHEIPLVCPADDADALAAGARLGAMDLAADATCSWTSTFLRCRQTESLVIRHAFGVRADRVVRRESFLLRERDYGDWDGLSDTDIRARDPGRFTRHASLRDPSERFYFRYPNGESRADVAQRMALFISKLHRSRYPHHVVFMHGITQRAFRMAWFDQPVDWFDREPNPPNASLLLLAREGPAGRWSERYLSDGSR